jgi:uncharacterized membrane protein YkvA (DUF1232 family)
MKKRLLIAFLAARKVAKVYARDRDKAAYLVEEASKKAGKDRSLLKDVKTELAALLRLLQAWVAGNYRSVPWRTIVLGLAAVVYFVNPFDLVPDFLPLVGLGDDVTVIAFVLASIRGDLEKFIVWEREQAIHLR